MNRPISTPHENGVGVGKVESAIAHFHTNGLKRYKLLIILNKFRVGIDHSAGTGFEPLIRHPNNSFKFRDLSSFKTKSRCKNSCELVGGILLVSHVGDHQRRPAFASTKAYLYS